MSFKTFVIQESLKSEYSNQLILYKERYHTNIIYDLKKMLENSWKSFAEKSNKKIKIEDSISVSSTPEKISSSRHRNIIEVSPSLKIPLFLSMEERDILIKESLSISEKVFNKLSQDWKEIFNIERNGKIKPWFKIIKDHDEIKFQYILSLNGEDFYKTLYSIRVEYGKRNSKTRDFDRIYLVVHNF